MKLLLFIFSLFIALTPIYSQELYKIKNGTKEGFINSSGNITIDAIYDDVDDFSEGLAKVKQGSRYGYINTSGKIVIQLTYV